MNDEDPKKKIILGIDPGTLITGYGVVLVTTNRHLSALDYGCIRPPPTRALNERYRILFESINDLIDRHSPDALSIETQYIDKNPRSGLKLGMACGVAILAASLRDIPIFEYAPSQAKRAVVGKGSASKQQVQAMVQRLLSLISLPEPEDASDALALAICHGNTCWHGLEKKHKI